MMLLDDTQAALHVAKAQVKTARNVLRGLLSTLADLEERIDSQLINDAEPKEAERSNDYDRETIQTRH